MFPELSRYINRGLLEFAIDIGQVKWVENLALKLNYSPTQTRNALIETHLSAGGLSSIFSRGPSQEIEHIQAANRLSLID